ncbi:MAG TPA: outer membrane protein transport protein [Pseudolabrys sp.]
MACSGVAAIVAATADANAGGFAVREQSSWGQGSSFAGVAAGGALSSMYWNPAAMTQIPGLQSESVLTGIMPSSTHTVNSGTFAAFGGAGDSGIDALVPASYYSWQLTPQLWVGLSINAPFGLSVRFPDMWAGRTYAEDTVLKTYNGAPTVAYQVNNWLAVGAGVQIQYAKADLATGLPISGTGVPPGLFNVASIEGNGWGFGVTAGITLTPTPTTTIGIGYRSAINQKINGTLSLPPGPAFTPAFGSTPGSVSTTLNLPDTVTLGLRQRLTPQWTALATFEWTNWSRIGTSNILQPSGANATVVGTPVRLPFQYSDGWFGSIGAEYQWNERLALRSGIGFEKSPITDDVRTPRLPDNDRLWLSIGGSYKWSEKIRLDAAYTHIFVKDTPINISAASGNPWFTSGVSYIGSADSHVDILSVAMTYRFDTPAAPAPKSTLPHK